MEDVPWWILCTIVEKEKVIYMTAGIIGWMFKSATTMLARAMSAVGTSRLGGPI
jgi:hypothetical protein